MKPMIIIPTYNEAMNLENIVNSIQETLSGRDFSILIVDDSSSDGTDNIAKDLSEKYKNIFILNRPSKLGLASAYIDGMKFSKEKGFDTFIEMDADFSHDPKYLPQMLKLLEDNDLVIGSRNIKGGDVVGWSFLRNFISKGGSLYSKIILFCPINDLTGGFNGYRSELVDKIGLDNIISKGYSFQIEMKYRAYKLKAKIKEFPIVFVDRKFGKSKMDKQIFTEALLNILKLRFLVK